MPKKRKVGNLLALAVLSYLVQRPMHPYELGRTLRENGDERSIKFNHGSLYMVVGQLEKAGFVAAEGTDRDGQRPERTVYALTDAGRTELGDWLRELVEEPQPEYPGFIAALSLIAALPPAEVLGLLRRRLDRLAPIRTQISGLIADNLARGLPELFLIEEQYRLAMADAEAAFVERLADRLADPATEWVRAWAEFYAKPETKPDTPDTPDPTETESDDADHDRD